MSLFMDTPDWTRPTEFPRLRGLVGFDFETVDPYIKTHGPSWAFPGVGKVIGVGVSMENGFDAYYPVGHEIGNMNEPEKVWAWLKHELETDPDPDLVLVVFNWGYEMGWLRRYGINPRCRVVDPGVAMALVDECRLGYSLNSIAKTILNEQKFGDDLAKTAEAMGMKDHMSKLDKMPPMYVGTYCEQDAALTRRLWTPLRKMISERSMDGILQLEHDILPVVLDMRWNGVRIDELRLEQQIEECKTNEIKLIDEIKRESGVNVEVWSSDSIADAFTLAGIKFPVTDKGKPSFKAEWLESHPDRLPQLIVEARRLNKLHGTFLTNYFAENIVNGRVHCTFSPLRSEQGGAVTGRFSSSNPNFQNLPARKPGAARMVRGNLLPEEGEKWGALDYSSQEPRLTVHFAALANCKGADRAVEEYNSNPRTDYHQFVANITGLPRKRAKDVNLGLPYGMGGARLCKIYLDLPTEWAIFGRGRAANQYFETRDEAIEATGVNPIEVAGKEGRAVLEKYHEKLPYTKEVMRVAEEAAKTRGYIKTLLGRRRHFLHGGEKPTKFNAKKAFPYKALNCIIQGSAADQTKKAMVDLHREGYRLLVTVHDEIGVSLPNEEAGRQAAEIMEQAVPLVVPTVVDVEIGDSWAASMGLPDED